jgi:hypothetical protein
MKMLYLMMEKSNGKYFVKVGQSRSLVQRRRVYKTHNPGAIMRSACAGTEAQERQCRRRLDQCGIRVDGSEWYRVPLPIFNALYLNGMGFFYPNRKTYDKEYFE